MENQGNLLQQNISPKQNSIIASQVSGTSKLRYNPENKNKSHDFFKETRINSCSYVKLNKGIAQAVAYYNPQKETYADKMQKSEYQKSLSHETFKVRPNLHSGMKLKPLEKYDPNSYRNRLPVQDAKHLTKNGSQIEIGDRSENYRRHFISQSKNTIGNFGKNPPVTNPGILSDLTKWQHKQQHK